MTEDREVRDQIHKIQTELTSTAGSLYLDIEKLQSRVVVVERLISMQEASIKPLIEAVTDNTIQLAKMKTTMIIWNGVIAFSASMIGAGVIKLIGY